MLQAWSLSARKSYLAKPLSFRFISLYVEPLWIILLLDELVSSHPR